MGMAKWADTVPFTHGEKEAVERSLGIFQMGSSGERGNSTARNQLLLASQACLGVGVGWDKFLIAGIKGGLFIVPGNCYQGGWSSERLFDVHFRPKATDRWGKWLPEALDEYLIGGKTLKQAAIDAKVPYARLRNRLEGMKNRLEEEVGLKTGRRRETSWLIKALAVTGRLRMTRTGEVRSTEAVC